jgi:hypothetical protein
MQIVVGIEFVDCSLRRVAIQTVVGIEPVDCSQGCTRAAIEPVNYSRRWARDAIRTGAGVESVNCSPRGGVPSPLPGLSASPALQPFYAALSLDPVGSYS